MNAETPNDFSIGNGFELEIATKVVEDLRKEQTTIKVVVNLLL